LIHRVVYADIRWHFGDTAALSEYKVGSNDYVSQGRFGEGASDG